MQGNDKYQPEQYFNVYNYIFNNDVDNMGNNKEYKNLYHDIQ